MHDEPLCRSILVILVVWFLLPRVARLMIHTPNLFCQAEDGIRVADVTGVQTCALPISMHEGDADLALDDAPAHGSGREHGLRGAHRGLTGRRREVMRSMITFCMSSRGSPSEPSY